MPANEDQFKSWMIGGLAGDPAAHTALLKALAPVLRAFYARRLSGANGDIEDLVQETLIAIHVRRASYDRERPFLAWLFAIARYKLIDQLRRRRHHVPLNGLEETLIEDCFEEASNARIDVERMLRTLPPKQEAAIRHTRIDGLDTREAATLAHIGESDVKVSVHRGLKALAARIIGERR